MVLEGDGSVRIAFQVFANRIGNPRFEGFPKRFEIVGFVEFMGDKFEWREVSRIGFCGEAKQFVILCNILSRDGFPKSNPIDATVDSVANLGDIMASDAVGVIPAETIGFL